MKHIKLALGVYFFTSGVGLFITVLQLDLNRIQIILADLLAIIFLAIGLRYLDNI